MSNQPALETVKADGGRLIDQIKHLVHEGNVRRIIIKQNEATVAEFPLTVGVVGTVLAPVLAAIGALAALMTDCTIEIERTETTPPTFAEPTALPTEELVDEELASIAPGD